MLGVRLLRRKERSLWHVPDGGVGNAHLGSLRSVLRPRVESSAHARTAACSGLLDSMGRQQGAACVSGIRGGVESLLQWAGARGRCLAGRG